jgi:hypothetical protein
LPTRSTVLNSIDDATSLEPLERYDHTWSDGKRWFGAPIFQFVSAIVSDAFQLDEVKSARLVNLGVWVVFGSALAILAVQLGMTGIGAIGAVLVVAVSPLGIQYSVAPMIDPSAVTLGLMSLVLALHFNRNGGWMWLAGSAVAAFTAAYIKPPVELAMVFPIAILAGKNLRLNSVVYGAALLGLILFMVSERVVDADSFLSAPSIYYGEPLDRFSWTEWAPIVHTGIFGLGNPILLLMSVAGFALLKFRTALFAVLLGSFLTILVFFRLNHVHDYYQLPLLVPYALGVGALLLLFTRQLNTLRGVALIFSFAVIFAIYAYGNPILNYTTDEKEHAVGRQISANTEPNEFVLWIEDRSSSAAFLYYAHRHRIMIQPDELLAQTIDTVNSEKPRAMNAPATYGYFVADSLWAMELVEGKVVYAAESFGTLIRLSK